MNRGCFKMIKIKELEEHFGKSFDEILSDNTIIEIGGGDYIKLGNNGYIKTSIDFAWEDYCKWEKDLYNNDVKKLQKDFYKWVEKCTIDDLFGVYELETYQRHFKVLDNGKVYYLNDYI